MRNNKSQEFLTKKESGDGITYAMYFIAIVMAFVMYAFLKFNVDVYVIESELKNGLHIAENSAITAAQDVIVSDIREDTYEAEINRMNIITRADASKTSWYDSSQLEKDQVQLVVNAFSSELKKQLNLNGSVPVKGSLRNLCGAESRITIDSMTIYEPVYDVKTTVSNTGNRWSINGIETDMYTFETEYKPKNWIVYNVSFDSNNNMLNVSKSVLPGTTVLYLNSDSTTRGRDDVLGATIEAKISTKFNGVKNIFATFGGLTQGIGLQNQVAQAGGIFTANPETRQYNVSVSQSVDIVLTDNDNRQQ